MIQYIVINMRIRSVLVKVEQSSGPLTANVYDVESDLNDSIWCDLFKLAVDGETFEESLGALGKQIDDMLGGK